MVAEEPPRRGQQQGLAWPKGVDEEPRQGLRHQGKPRRAEWRQEAGPQREVKGRRVYRSPTDWAGGRAGRIQERQHYQK